MIQMSRQLSLVLVAACLSVGCATHQPAASEVLVSRILHAPTDNLVCQPGELRMCTVDADDEKHCTCMDHSEVFPRR
jgi:hypothetical protein